MTEPARKRGKGVDSLRLFQVGCSLVAYTIERERMVDEGRGEDGKSGVRGGRERESCRGGFAEPWGSGRGISFEGSSSRRA